LKKVFARAIKKNVRQFFCEAVPLGGTAAGRSDWSFSEIFGKMSSSFVVNVLRNFTSLTKT
jgi:hypothetical protein